jgi:hypothetical protein
VTRLATMPRRWLLPLFVALGAAMPISAAKVAFAEKPTIVQVGWGPLKFNAGVAPKVLPKHRLAPVSVNFSGELESLLEPAPALTEMTVDIDRNGAIDAVGLRSCPRRQLRTLATENARRQCRNSIVGVGVAHIEAPSLPQIEIPLTLFNAGVEDGVTTVLIHGVVPVPTPSPTIATLKIHKIHEGRFGLRAVATIPPIANGEGALVDFSFKIERRFVHDGEKRSFATARCPDGRLESRVASFSFGSEERLDQAGAVRACTPSAPLDPGSERRGLQRWAVPGSNQ